MVMGGTMAMGIKALLFCYGKREFICIADWELCDVRNTDNVQTSGILHFQISRREKNLIGFGVFNAYSALGALFGGL